jgi:hypothetical protein
VFVVLHPTIDQIQSCGGIGDRVDPDVIALEDLPLLCWLSTGVKHGTRLRARAISMVLCAAKIEPLSDGIAPDAARAGRRSAAHRAHHYVVDSSRRRCRRWLSPRRSPRDRGKSHSVETAAVVPTRNHRPFILFTLGRLGEVYARGY